uniref:Uncharacterized protein n=1 Tax=Arundo donax TaxID=35708 RepID=A0A0A9HS35_ARUDO
MQHSSIAFFSVICQCWAWATASTVLLPNLSYYA